MELLYRNCKLTQGQIGLLLGNIDYSAVSLARKRLADQLENNQALFTRFEELKTELVESLISQE